MTRTALPIPRSLRIAAAGVALLLSACGGGESEDGVVVLHVADQLNHLKSSLAVAGEDKPTSYRIEWSNFLGGPAVIAAQTGGSVDIGWMAETPMVFAQAAGSPVKVIAVTRGLKANSSSIALAVPVASPIKAIGDLKGRSVAYAPGTIAHYLLVRALERDGLTLDDIKTIRVAAPTAASLDNKIADAIVITEPLLTKGLDEGKIRVLAYGGQPLTPGFGYLVASDNALKDPRLVAAMGDFVKRAARATRWERENVEKAAPAIARHYSVTAPVAERILRRTPMRYSAIDETIAAEHQREADVFFRLGLVRTRLDAAAIFDKRFNPLVTAVETPQ